MQIKPFRCIIANGESREWLSKKKTQMEILIAWAFLVCESKGEKDGVLRGVTQDGLQMEEKRKRAVSICACAFLWHRTKVNSRAVGYNSWDIGRVRPLFHLAQYSLHQLADHHDFSQSPEHVLYHWAHTPPFHYHGAVGGGGETIAFLLCCCHSDERQTWRCFCFS